jgi:hypothetical protein
MVYYSHSFDDDLFQIFIGLLTWKKHTLSIEFCYSYIRDIELHCRNLDCKFFHESSSYNLHRKYGEYVHRYKRNKNTCWYIIYNKDLFDNVFIERIMNNYVTI